MKKEKLKLEKREITEKDLGFRMRLEPYDYLALRGYAEKHDVKMSDVVLSALRQCGVITAPRTARDRTGEMMMEDGFELYTNGETLIEAMPITYGDYAMGRDPAAYAARLAQHGYVTRHYRREDGCLAQGDWMEAARFEAEWSRIGATVQRLATT